MVGELAAVIAFFIELGLELQGEAAVEGGWVDQLLGMDGSEQSPSMRTHRSLGTAGEPAVAQNRR